MKTNLLIIHESMAGGGAERVLTTLLKNLDRNKFSITLLLIYKKGVFLEDIPQDVELLSLFGPKRGLWHRLWTHLYRLRNAVRERKARRLLNGRKFDSIVSFREGPPSKLHSMLMDLAPRNVSWIHTDLQTGRWQEFWFRTEEEKEFYRKIDGLAFVSQDACNAFGKMYDTDVHCEVIYNPIDTESIILGAGKEEKAFGEPFTIINVGRLIELKRQDRLVRAAALLRERGLKFKINILGVGDREKELKSLADELGVSDCINFPGFITNPYEWVKKADVFCLTSATEGYPTVIAESLCIGTPVVSTRITGTVEMLSHGGGVFTGDTPEDIADKLEWLMREPRELARLKAETAEAFKQFRIENVMRSIQAFITGSSSKD